MVLLFLLFQPSVGDSTGNDHSLLPGKQAYLCMIDSEFWKMQEGLCADAASFDLPSSLLTACISEAKRCVDLSVARRENSNDKSCNPDNFAILRGKARVLSVKK